MAQLAFKVQSKLITSKHFTQTVSEAVRERAWALAALTSCPPILSRPIKQIRNSESRKRRIIQCGHTGKKNKEALQALPTTI